MSFSPIFRATLIAIWSVTWSVAAEPIFQPWIPQHLDDWPALVAEAKTYAETTNAAQKATNASVQFYVSIEDHPFSFGKPLPNPPEDVAPGDYISLMCWTVKDRTSSQGCGMTCVWRAKKHGAAGATLTYCIQEDTCAWPYPNQTASVPFFDAEIAKRKPTSGAWKTLVGPLENNLGNHWLASWQRLDDRARTRDDAQGIAPELRPEDLRYLSESPTTLKLPPAAPAEFSDYQIRVKNHAGVQQALERFRAGFLARPVIVYVVKRDGPGEMLGIKPGDNPIAVGASRVGSQKDFKNKLWDIGPAKQKIQFARLGSEPITITVSSGELDIDYTNGAPDPGMAVLEAVANADKTMVTDAAVAIYAFGETDLIAGALSRLDGHIPTAAMAFLQAWNLAALNDVGGVESILSQKFASADSDLIREINHLRNANRSRSGHSIWAWPEKFKDPKFEGVFRRMVSSLSIPERFSLFDGKIDSTYFSVAANDRVLPLRKASSLMSVNGDVLKPTDTYDALEASFGSIPSRCQLSFNFTLIPSQALPSSKGHATVSPYQFLSVGFETRSPRLITSQGMGDIRIHTNGTVSFHCSVREINFGEGALLYQPLPIPVFVDGISANNLRIVRIAQTQRIELNGHLVSQGFLPLIEESDEENGTHLGIVLSVKDAECRISDLKIQVPKEGVEANGF